MSSQNDNNSQKPAKSPNQWLVIWMLAGTAIGTYRLVLEASGAGIENAFSMSALVVGMFVPIIAAAFFVYTNQKVTERVAGVAFVSVAVNIAISIIMLLGESISTPL